MPRFGDIFEVLCQGFNGNFPQVEYKTVATHEGGIEERIYPGGLNWACVQHPKESDEEAVCTKAFDYLMGANEQEAKIGMTMPSVTTVKEAETQKLEELRFFVTGQFQEKPPLPKNEGVEIKVMPEMTVFVKTFGGFAKEANWVSCSKELHNWANENGHKVARDVDHMRASYDAPSKLCNRRNEVWLLKATAE